MVRARHDDGTFNDDDPHRGVQAPWIGWKPHDTATCANCGDRTVLPRGIDGDTLVQFLKAYVRVHRTCPPGPRWPPVRPA